MAMPAPTTLGIRDRVLRYIVEHGPLPTHEDIHEGSTRTSYHAAVHVCWQLRKDGLIVFQESKRGRSTHLTRIEATTRGRMLIVALDEVKEINPSTAIDAAISVANGQARRIGLPPRIEDTKEEPVIATLAEEPRTKRKYTRRVHPEPKLPEGLHAPIIPRLTNTIDLAMYPYVEAIVRKYANRDKVRQAADMLEAAGLIDLAAQALEQGGEPTELEKEILDIVNIATGGKD